MMSKVLCVDDEQNVLDGFQRQLRKHVALTTRGSGEEGIKAIQEEGPFAVIVSDMQMPNMDGVTFLAKVREIAPDTIRMMLTGNADQQTAIKAVNDGHIFRFLNKPCSSEDLLKAIEAGVEQHSLITAEKELLEKTLKGSIQVLVDVLSMTSPVAFSRAMRLRQYVAQMAGGVDLKETWQLEVAAMLSQIGFVTIPGEVLEKFFAGDALTDVEKKMMSSCPEIGRKLIANIPRLETVAEIIARHQYPFGGDKMIDIAADLVNAGSRILQVAVDFDILYSRGTSRRLAIQTMSQKSDVYDRRVVEMLDKIELEEGGRVSNVVKVQELVQGMVLEEDIRSDKGVLVLPKGSEVNCTIHQRLVNFLAQGVIRDTVRVSVLRHRVAGTN